MPVYFKFDFKCIMHRNLQICIYILVYSEILKIKMTMHCNCYSNSVFIYSILILDPAIKMNRQIVVHVLT